MPCRYCRCEFKLPAVVDRPKGERTRHPSEEELIVTAYHKWEDVQEWLVKPQERPVILNRSSSTNTSNPFGSTFCYGVQDMIFEVGAGLCSLPVFSHLGKLFI